MDEYEYDFVPERNPCYGIACSKSQDTATSSGFVSSQDNVNSQNFVNSQDTGTSAEGAPGSQDTGTSAEAGPQDTAIFTRVAVKSKKPARDCPCSWVSIGLVLVGVVACVSMAVAVWSIAEVHNISNTEPTTELPLPVTTCLQLASLSPSGYYWVRASNGSAVRVYCDMTRSCGGVTGGWMRVASLNFNDTSTSCPSGLRERVGTDIRTCGIELSGAACPSVMFSTSGVEYTKVCGKVIAFHDMTPDAFNAFFRGPNVTIDSNYVDGVSLTHGHTPRNHIWTFAAAVDEFGEGTGESVCECSNSIRPGMSPPSFVGQDYFCDSGFDAQIMHAVRNPLWDGAGCGSNSTCCSFNNPPWFHKELPSPTSDDIEMRVWSDEERENEDIAMYSVEIYVQ